MATPDAAPSSTAAATTGPRDWALDKVDATVRVKPRRPYTPYNLFYLLERELVVQGNAPSLAKENAKKKAAMVADHRKAAMGERREDDIPIPARYKHVVLLPMWYEPNLKEKRKHRKTHGKISFKDLTEIISKNWSAIDVETKSYCTRLSEMGRTRYKETMTRYNASQKILQLKKEHAAMESAREKRMEPFQQKTECDSPGRQGGKRKSNPVTPDRMLSYNAPIVTPPNSGQNNRVPMFVPSGPGAAAAAAFHQYGPPPPMPPPMPHNHSIQGHHRPPLSMPMYHQHQHQNQHHQHHQHHQHRQHHQHHQYHQYHQHHHQPQYSYPKPPPLNTMNNIGYHDQAAELNNTGHYDGRSNGGNFFNIPNGQGVDVNVNVNVSVKNQEAGPARKIHATTAPPEKSGKTTLTLSEKGEMTHDEAMRLCTLMGKDSPGKMCDQYERPLNDTLLQAMPSFDFDDYHSLSTEDDGNLSREIQAHDLFDQVENQDENNVLDMFRSELLPLEEEEPFHDIHLIN